MPRSEPEIAVTVFASYGTSLETWDRAGMFGRETAYLRMLQEQAGPLALVKYGSGDAEDRLSPQSGLAAVRGGRLRMPRAAYSVLAPIAHWRLLRRSVVFRTNQLRGAWTAALAAMLHRRPLLVRTGYVWSQFNRAAGGSGVRAKLVMWLERFALRRAGAVVVASAADREYVVQRHGILAEKVHIVPNPIDTATFRPGPAIAREPGLVTFVGRLEPQKGAGLLIEAVMRTPGAKLRIIGDGSLRPQLERMAAGCGRVEFMGAVPNEKLPSLLRRSQLFVLPSLYEGTPKSLLEAMACGVAVVAARTPGNTGVVTQGENGLLAEPTPGALAEAISSLLGDAALRERLGEAAARYVREHHSAQSAAAQEAALIRSLAAERGLALPVGDCGTDGRQGHSEAGQAA